MYNNFNYFSKLKLICEDPCKSVVDSAIVPGSSPFLRASRYPPYPAATSLA